jgi:putative NADH-flavin reductase
MNVVVFGSTGQTGLQLVEQLVAAGHTVTAFARTPAKVNTFAGKVRVIQGDARDIEGIRTAVKGQDAVFNAVAQRYLKKDDLQTVFAGLLTQAMEEAGVTRLIVLSAWGSGDSATQAIFLFKILRFTMLRNVFKDKADAEEIIEKSTLTYTLV